MKIRIIVLIMGLLSSCYPVNGKVINTEYNAANKQNIITVETSLNECYQFTSDKKIYIGDNLTLIMYDNGTKDNIFDDCIIDIKR